MTDINADTVAERVRSRRAKAADDPAIPAADDMVARATIVRDQRNADLAQQARREATDAAVAEARRQGVKGPRPEEMTPQARAALKAIETEREKIHAARRALEQREDPLVRVRILKLGNGKISTGVHVKSIGDAYFFHKEETDMPQSIAAIYEDRGWVEVL